MKDFIDILTEAYSDAAKLIISRLYSGNSDTYRNLNRRAFNISIGVDLTSTGRTPKDVLYMSVDELADRIQPISETHVKVVSSSEYYRNTEPDRSIDHAIRSIEEDTGILQAMTNYTDTDENWNDLVSQIRNSLQGYLPYTNIGAMAVNKSANMSYNEVEYDLYRDSVEKIPYRDDMPICVLSLKACLSVTDEVKKGIAYDVYHRLFGNKPVDVHQYIIDENEFVNLLKERKALTITAPLKQSQDVDYKDKKHLKLRKSMIMAMFTSESKMIDKRVKQDDNSPNQKWITNGQIEQILNLYGFSRELFVKSHVWDIDKKGNKPQSIKRYYINLPVLTEKFIEILEKSINDIDGLSGQRSRRSYEGIGYDNLSLFRLINNIEDIISCEETYQVLRALVLNYVIRGYMKNNAHGQTILTEDCISKVSQYNKQDELNVILKIAKYKIPKCNKLPL